MTAIRMSDFGPIEPTPPSSDSERRRIEDAMRRYPNLSAADIGDIAEVPEAVVLGVRAGM